MIELCKNQNSSTVSLNNLKKLNSLKLNTIFVLNKLLMVLNEDEADCHLKKEKMKKALNIQPFGIIDLYIPLKEDK